MKTQNKPKAHDSPIFLKITTFLTTLTYYTNVIYTIPINLWYQGAVLGYNLTKVKVSPLVINQYVFFFLFRASNF